MKHRRGARRTRRGRRDYDERVTMLLMRQDSLEACERFESRGDLYI
jgi:hypothetical protein